MWNWFICEKWSRVGVRIRMFDDGYQWRPAASLVKKWREMIRGENAKLGSHLSYQNQINWKPRNEGWLIQGRESLLFGWFVDDETSILIDKCVGVRWWWCDGCWCQLIWVTGANLTNQLTTTGIKMCWHYLIGGLVGQNTLRYWYQRTSYGWGCNRDIYTRAATSWQESSKRTDYQRTCSTPQHLIKNTFKWLHLESTTFVECNL